MEIAIFVRWKCCLVPMSWWKFVNTGVKHISCRFEDLWTRNISFVWERQRYSTMPWKTTWLGCRGNKLWLVLSCFRFRCSVMTQKDGSRALSGHFLRTCTWLPTVASPSVRCPVSPGWGCWPSALCIVSENHTCAGVSASSNEALPVLSSTWPSLKPTWIRTPRSSRSTADTGLWIRYAARAGIRFGDSNTRCVEMRTQRDLTFPSGLPGTLRCWGLWEQRVVLHFRFGSGVDGGLPLRSLQPRHGRDLPKRW